MKELISSSADEVTGIILQKHSFVMSNIVRAAWHKIFECKWRRFEGRFVRILADLGQLSNLLDEEVAFVHLHELKTDSLSANRYIVENEERKFKIEKREVEQWLGVDWNQNFTLHSPRRSRDTHSIWISCHAGSGRPTRYFENINAEEGDWVKA